MNNKKKILVFENQKTEFAALLVELVKHNFDVFPRMDNYSHFTDCVRLRVDKRYDKIRRDFCFNQIVEFINNFNPDLLMIDYYLAGYHDGYTGLDLANEIYPNLKNSEIPLMVLSKTSSNSREAAAMHTFFKNAVWVEKGFGSTGLSKPPFFQTQVLNKIRLLLGKSDQDATRERLVVLKTFKTFLNYLQILDSLLEKDELTERDIKFVKQFERVQRMSQYEITQTFNDFNNGI